LYIPHPTQAKTYVEIEKMNKAGKVKISLRGKINEENNLSNIEYQDAISAMASIPITMQSSKIYDLCDSHYVNKNVKRNKRKSADDVQCVEREVRKESRTTPTIMRLHTSNIPSSEYQGGPQVEIVNGKIVLKESSLVLNSNTNAAFDEYEEVTEGIHPTATYSSFVKRRHSPAWGVEETRLFYQALRQCGTEFTMMQAFFPGRTRKQLKMKFFREEKSHPALVKRCLNSSLPLELDAYEAHLGKLENEVTMDSNGIDVIEVTKTEAENFEEERMRTDVNAMTTVHVEDDERATKISYIHASFQGIDETIEIDEV
jgi:transcription factor TFIIIB component B''